MRNRIFRGLEGMLQLSTVLAGSLPFLAGAAQAQVIRPPATSADALKQQQPSAGQAETPADVQEIVVTGSALPTQESQIPVPVNIIGQAQIEKGGVNNNVLDILRKQIPAFQGRSNAGNSNANNTNQNTAGGSQVQLRNLDTLVLVNGRRVAINAIAGLGGKAFVDVSQIPAGAIDRLEVLNDGASAIYGSDAIGGVVNIILKKDYEGLDFGGRLGIGDRGYEERSADFTAGINLKKGVNLTVSGFYSKTDPLFQRDRDFSSPFYLTSAAVPSAVGTAVLANGINSPSQKNPVGLAAVAPNIAALIANGTYRDAGAAQVVNGIPIVGTGVGGTYDLSQYQTLLLGQEQKSVSAAFNADLTGDGLIEFFADGLYSQNNSFTQFRPVTTGITVPAGSPFTPFTVATNTTFADVAQPHDYFNSNRSWRVTAGLRGELPFISPDWNWEAAYVHSQNTLRQYQTGVIYAPNLARAIAGGFDAAGNAVAGGAFSKVFSGFSTANPLIVVPALDPFARSGTQSAAALANVIARERLDARSKLDSGDVKIVGTLFELPAGKPGIAVGGSWRRESLVGATDPNGSVTGPFKGGYIGGQAADPFAQSRRIWAVFAEVKLPIFGDEFHIPGFHEFDLIGAVRHENYSDAGSSTIPKVGFRWQPVDNEITIRGSFAKSFTAPTLYAEFGPTNNRLAGPGIIPAAFPGLAAGLSPVQDGNNPLLQPSKAKSYSLSLVLKPNFVPRLKIDLEFNSIRQTGQPGGIGFSNIFLDVNQKGAASIFSGNIAKGNFPGLPGATGFANPGDLRAYLAADPANYNNVYAIDRFTNLGGIRVKTLNSNVSYVIPTDTLGDFHLNSLASIFLTYKFQAIPTQKFYEYAGTATNGGTGVQGTLPRVRVYSTIDWDYRNTVFTVANSYVSGVNDLGVGGITFETNYTRTPPTSFRGHVKSYMTWDLRVSHTFKDELDGTPLRGMQISAGVNNVFDRMPPISTNVGTPSAAFTDNNADVSTYSPIGRLFYVQASFHF